MEVGWGLLEVSTAFYEGSCRACWWGCGSRAKAVEGQVTGTGQIGVCTGNVQHHRLHLQQKLLSCPAGPCEVLGW